MRTGVFLLALLCLSGCATNLKSIKSPDNAGVELRLGALEGKTDYLAQEMALLKNTQSPEVLFMELARSPVFWVVAVLVLAGFVSMIVILVCVIIPFFRDLNRRREQEIGKK